MVIERMQECDIQETSQMIARAVRSPSFASFYPECSLEYVAEGLDISGVRRRMETLHFYVLKEDGRVVGCGGAGACDGSQTDSELSAIFIDPQYQGRGYGRKLIQALENDEYCRRARRIEISASLSAIPFYRKLGYEHKNHALIYEDGQVKLEKYPKHELNGGHTMLTKVDLLGAARAVDQLYVYQKVGALNGHVLSVVNVEDRTLDFHVHEQSDELFYVIEGGFHLETDEGLIRLNAGEMIIVPKGVRHRPVVKELTRFLMIELQGTLNKENSGALYQE